MAIAQFSGLASGIDSAALIDAYVEARQITNDIRKKEIEHLSSENDALDELNTKISALYDLIDKFRTVNGGGVGKTTSSYDEGVATATALASAINASYSLNVTSVANPATASFNNSYSSDSSYVSTAGSGNITVKVGTGSEQKVITVAVTQDSTTLAQLAAAINSDSNAEGRVSASVVNVGGSSADYRLVINSLQSGTSKGSLEISADAAITELTGAPNQTVSQAANAVFTLGGINGSITRDSNLIDDVVSGMTFNLVDTGETDITVTNNADATVESLEEIVTAYNEIVEYINENDLVDRVEDGDDVDNTYGSLAKTRIDNDFLSEFRTALASAEASSGTSVTSMSELGLKTNRDGTISIDEEQLKDAVASDPSGATQVLNNWADSASGVDGFMYQYTKLNGYIDIAQEGNSSETENLQDQINQLDRQIDKMKESMQKRFANLEKISSQMQTNSQSISTILSSISR